MSVTKETFRLHSLPRCLSFFPYYFLKVTPLQAYLKVANQVGHARICQDGIFFFFRKTVQTQYFRSKYFEHLKDMEDCFLSHLMRLEVALSRIIYIMLQCPQLILMVSIYPLIGIRMTLSLVFLVFYSCWHLKWVSQHELQARRLSWSESCVFPNINFCNVLWE